MSENIATEVKNIVYLGPEGSYTEMAAEKVLKILGYENFKLNIRLSIKKVIEAVDNNSGYIGIVPIENSIEGIVRETVDNLLRTTSRVMLTHETILPIRHCLISKSTNKKTISKIISIGKALAQCQYYISNNFPPDVEIITASSTSDAVKQLLELDETYAAIGSMNASRIYNLNVLDEEINDRKII